MEFQSVVVAYSTDGSAGDLIENLRTDLKTEVVQIDANHLEIRKSVTRADLEPIFAESGARSSPTRRAYHRSPQTR